MRRGRRREGGDLGRRRGRRDEQSVVGRAEITSKKKRENTIPREIRQILRNPDPIVFPSDMRPEGSKNHKGHKAGGARPNSGPKRRLENGQTTLKLVIPPRPGNSENAGESEITGSIKVNQHMLYSSINAKHLPKEKTNYLAVRMNTKYPILPIHTLQERQLFKELYKGQSDFTDLLKQWTEKANGVTIFYKKIEHFKNYLKTFLKVQNSVYSLYNSRRERKELRNIHIAENAKYEFLSAVYPSLLVAESEDQDVEIENPFEVEDEDR